MNGATLEGEESINFRRASPNAQNRLDLQTEVPVRPETGGASPDADSAAPRRKGKGRSHFVLGAFAVTALLAVAGVWYVKYVLPYESTDDAFVEAHITPVAPQVAGRVEHLLVEDNQEVQQGQVLVEIDPSDFQVKLDQTRADLAAARSRLEQANAQLAVDQAKVAQEKANIVSAEAEAARAKTDFKRYQSIGNSGVSESQLDLADTQARSSAAEVDVAHNRELAAESQLGLTKAAILTAGAEVQRSQAAVRQAELDLSYTQVKASQAGFVTHRTVEPGAYVQTGQALLAVVPRQVWVIANFKETQLARMHPGQPVDVRVDAYPGVNFHGHVDSIQSGAGAKFSLLPPENASGNYVKVVQRVPVKIALDGPTEPGCVLGPGMSVVPRVKVD